MGIGRAKLPFRAFLMGFWVVLSFFYLTVGVRL